MVKIGKNNDGVRLFLTDEEFIEVVKGGAVPYGTNQQKAKMRKLIKKYKNGAPIALPLYKDL